MKKGVFISIEGGEACGKSTQVRMLKEYISTLENKDDFIFVREPGGTKLAEKIRELLLDVSDDAPLPITELLLFCASRVQNVQKNIIPALEQGKVIIADRFYDSTIAYQGSARGIMPAEKILELTKMIIGDLKPDKTFYLKISPQEAFKRKNHMGEALDRMELEGIDFHKRVEQGYDYISSIESERFCVIDATLSPEEISSQIINQINTLLDKQNQ